MATIRNTSIEKLAAEHGEMFDILAAVSPQWVVDEVESDPADALDSPVVEKVVGGFDVPFEMLIVEAPPVTTAADALSLAQLTGGVVLCVRSWSSYLSTVDDTMNQLAQVRANVLGIMVT